MAYISPQRESPPKSSVSIFLRESKSSKFAKHSTNINRKHFFRVYGVGGGPLVSLMQLWSTKMKKKKMKKNNNKKEAFRGLSNEQSYLVWLQLAQWFLRWRLKCKFTDLEDRHKVIIIPHVTWCTGKLKAEYNVFLY